MISGHPCGLTQYFNGAALVGVRREVDLINEIVNGRDFNGAALVGVRRDGSCVESLAGRTTSTEPHSLECGEKKAAQVSDGEFQCTSTEPHSLECGEKASEGAVRPFEKLQRSRTRWSAERSRQLGQWCACWLNFNGAALVGVRRDRAAETRAAAGHRTSTEPHSLECGEDNGVNATLLTYTYFNGAALVGVRREGGAE